MNEEIIFTIIIPCYNCEKTIEDAISSILTQNVDKYEIILINDGSTDNTKKTIEKYKSNKIKIINQKNEGVSSARNKGISTALGKYILFLDSDDELEPNFLRQVHKLTKKDYDSIIFGYNLKSKEKKESINFKNQEININNKWQQIIQLLNEHVFIMSCCNKLYKSEYLKKINFDTNIANGEDLLFNLEYFNICQKTIYITNLVGYNYNIIEKNFKYRKNSIKNHVLISNKLYQICESNNIDKEQIIRYFWTAVIYDAIGLIKSKKISNKTKKIELLQIKNSKLYNQKVSFKNFSIKKRIIIKLLTTNIHIAFVFVKIYCLFI